MQIRSLKIETVKKRNSLTNIYIYFFFNDKQNDEHKGTKYPSTGLTLKTRNFTKIEPLHRFLLAIEAQRNYIL